MKKIALAFYRDEVGKELLLFKKENQGSINRWLHYVDKNFEYIFKGFQVDYIVRALGSDETSTYDKNTPLDLMGRLLAKKFNAEYITDILTKTRTEQLKFAGGEYNRKKILDHKYHCGLKGLRKNGTYLIIDDVSTTGTTFNEIGRAIGEASNNQANINCFALVKTLWNKDYTSDKQEFNSKFYKKLTA